MRSILVAALLLSTACASSDRPDRPTALDPVRAACVKLVESGKARSIAIAVAQHGKVVWEEAFGEQDAERHVAATPDTMYTLASTGRSITGTTILALAARGVIDLDAPVGRYLRNGELTIHAADPAKVTVRELLRMDVAIPHLRWHHWTDVEGTRLTNRELLQRYAMVVAPLDGELHYSNMTYGVLAQIAENAAGEPFADVVRKEVFEPLGMTHASLHPLAADARWLARPYGGDNMPRPYDYSDPEGGAGYRASVHDLLRYAMAHLGDVKASMAVSTSSLAAMHRTTDGYYAGWGHINDESGIRFALANGGIVGASSEIKLVPEDDIAVVCLTNNNGVEIEPIVDGAIAALDPRYEGKMELPASFADRPFSVAAPMVGAWRGEIETWERHIPATMQIANDGTIVISVDGGAPVPLTKLRIDSGFVRGECPCGVPISDAAGVPTVDDIAMRLDGDVWNGSVRVISKGPRGDFSLTAYATFSRDPRS